MKKLPTVLVATILAATISFLLAGCGGSDGRTSPVPQQDVSEVLQQQTEQVEEEQEPTSDGFVPDSGTAYDEVDVDLTAMSPDMVYVTVYDMVANPAGYVGKVVRMEGTYYHAHYDETDQDYFYVVIQYATACCAQGLEFVWGDGSRTWPDDYPEDGHEVVVTGVFEVYREGGNGYVHLVSASMEDA